MKKCSKCEVEKPLEDFHRNASCLDGRRPDCKDCVREYRRQYYKRNAKKKREYSRIWYADNADRAKASRNQWAEDNPDKILSASRRYRRANRSAVRERGRRWEVNNHAKVLANAARRRARKAGATVGDPTAIASREAEIRESRWCVACATEVDDLHVDHIVPLARGGSHSVDNLQGLCARHNLEKGSKLPAEVTAGAAA